MPSRKRRRLPGHQHDHTDAPAAGVAPAAQAPGTISKQPLLEAATVVPVPKWAPPVSRAGMPSSPKAAVELEVLRVQALDRLRSKLASLCTSKGLAKAPLLAFERWRFACQLESDETTSQEHASSAPRQQRAPDVQPPPKRQKKAPSSVRDPVIPGSAAASAAAPQAGLVSDLAKAGMAQSDATEAAEQLAAAAVVAAAAVAKRAQQLASGAAASAQLADVLVAFHKHSVDLSAGGERVMVTREAYGKLAGLYRLHAPQGEALPPLQQQPRADESAEGQEGIDGKEDEEGGEGEAQQRQGKRGARDPQLDAEAAAAEAAARAAAGDSAAAAAAPDPARAAFHARLFALLLRYKSLQGHGFQAAVGPPVFRLLRRRLAVGFECFASPLNASFARCASAFPDVDGPFGSCGSFFRLNLKHGSYECNPPFVAPIMDRAASHMHALLQSAEAAGGALSFSVVIPGWQETKAWRLVSASPFLKQRVVVAAAEHGFCDGASHQRRDLYRQSPYDTGVFVLQTSAAAAKWRTGGAFEQEVRQAFAECIPSAAAIERQRRKRGASEIEHWGVAPAAAAAAAAALPGADKTATAAAPPAAAAPSTAAAAAGAGTSGAAASGSGASARGGGGGGGGGGGSGSGGKKGKRVAVVPCEAAGAKEASGTGSARGGAAAHGDRAPAPAVSGEMKIHKKRKHKEPKG